MSESLILLFLKEPREQITHIALFLRAARAIRSRCSFVKSDESNLLTVALF